MSSSSWTGLDFRGVLKGETNGFERVLEALSRRRRLAAGVDMVVLVNAVVSAVVLVQ